MGKKIILLSVFISIIALTTYKNFMYTAPYQSTLFEDIFLLLKHNKIDEALQKTKNIPSLASLRGQHDETILHRAAELGNPELIEIIVTKDVTINGQDKRKETPLMYAVKVHNVPTVTKLLELGADTSIKNIFNETALDIAKHYKSRFEMIGPHGIGLRGPVDPANTQNIKNDFDTIIALLQQSKSSVIK